MAERAQEAFTAAMDADLNISEGLAAVFELVRQGNTLLEQGVGAEGASVLLETLNGMDSVLDLLKVEDEDIPLPAELQAMIDAREEARRRKEWEKADQIRDQLREAGIILEDTPDGPRWKRI